MVAAMRLQLLSDLHLETEPFEPQPAPGAELLVLAGDIDATWEGLARFARWPVPVLYVAGNHEFDGREWHTAWPALRAHTQALGIRMLERESLRVTDDRGRTIRFVATARWSDFDLFGAAGRERAMRAANYFMRLMAATRDGRPFDAQAVREESLVCRAWLERALGAGVDLDMANDGKKARKADKASKPKKLKIPKKVGSIKIPKELRREGNGLLEALKGLLATEIAAAAITAIARSPRRRPGN